MVARDFKNFEWDQDDPLARVLPETESANHVLRAYARLGPLRPGVNVFHERLMREIDQAQGAADLPPHLKHRWHPSTVRGWCMNCRWVERLRRFDELEEERLLKEFQASAVKHKQTMIDTLDAYHLLVVKAMAVLDPASASFAEVTAALQMIIDRQGRLFDGRGYNPPKREPGRPPGEYSRMKVIFNELSDEELVELASNLEFALTDLDAS